MSRRDSFCRTTINSIVDEWVDRWWVNNDWGTNVHYGQRWISTLNIDLMKISWSFFFFHGHSSKSFSHLFSRAKQIFFLLLKMSLRVQAIFLDLSTVCWGQIFTKIISNFINESDRTKATFFDGNILSKHGRVVHRTLDLTKHKDFRHFREKRWSSIEIRTFLLVLIRLIRELSVTNLDRSVITLQNKQILRRKETVLSERRN